MLQDFLVDKHSDHVAIVVQRQVLFDDLGHGPESLFFVHTVEQARRDEIHALTIADRGVAHDNGL